MSVPRWILRLYNRVSPHKWRPNNPDDMISSTSFFYDELRRALAEQAFGIARYDVAGQSTPLAATASVTLLEGITITVTLDVRGYQVDSGQVFESIEGLLQFVSPMFEQMRTNALFAKLRRLQ
ncbi:hypothetical protein F5I97DRAFT_1928689 [Phlebopus sp. FC_14]|nr:hypothetical protein F5I97DRAFT_1928689 [Phlebopus sp. FC_14]